MGNTNLFVIFNPCAAKGKAKKAKRPISSYFEKHGFTCVFHETTCRGHASQLASQAVRQGEPIVIAAGGDGTINEVVDGLLREQKELKLTAQQLPRLGIIPVGRGNDFAWMMHIPHDICKACALIVSNKSRFVDAGISYGGDFPDGRYFINGEGMGFEPLVTFIGSSFKHLSGTLSYLFAFLRIMGHYPRPCTIKMGVDDKESFEVLTQQVSICNGRRMGSAFIMGPNAQVDDGFFDLVYANKPVLPSKLVSTALRFLKGTQLELDDFTQIRCTKVNLVSLDNPMPVHVDGEKISLGCLEFHCELLPAALAIFSVS